MSMSYCENCGSYFDEDYNVEHFEECEEETVLELAGRQINLGALCQ